MNNSQIKWAINILNIEDYQLDPAIPEIIQDTPWSTVYRFKITQGYIFLKKVPSALSLEPKIINILHNEFHADVPKIIAENPGLHCFLMSDAGIRLYDYFKDSFENSIFIQVLHHYVELQILTLDKVKLFLEAGVPDWRLEKLPTLYQDLISHEAILLEDGLKADELVKLQQLTPKLYLICEKLSHYKVKEKFGHADFHHKNILINIDTKQTTIIDLGEVVITHPFFSLHNCLHMAKENFALSNEQYEALQFECLKPWLELDTDNNLLEILSLIQQCWSIHAVLGEFRLMNSIDQTDLHKLRKQGRLAKKLRYWINENEK
ncbi:MAG: phosphotransferase [Gammaproteobacteria bacterium]|nr:phosphotransferase [Gammaproteobacteria bacterium]MCW5584124.1 phosphotransferase [Gammaproteobacteria bacterium]